MRASSAIPVVFPAVRVEEPESTQDWYFDGGTRLNMPIKPALELGADRLIVVGLNSLAPAPRSPAWSDLFDGTSQIAQGLLADPVINDVETLATMNEILIHRGGSGRRKIVPYIFVAPQTPNRIGEIAGEVYEERYAGLGASGARAIWRFSVACWGRHRARPAESFSAICSSRPSSPPG